MLADISRRIVVPSILGGILIISLLPILQGCIYKNYLWLEFVNEGLSENRNGPKLPFLYTFPDDSCLQHCSNQRDISAILDWLWNSRPSRQSIREHKTEIEKLLSYQQLLLREGFLSTSDEEILIQLVNNHESVPALVTLLYAKMVSNDTQDAQKIQKHLLNNPPSYRVANSFKRSGLTLEGYDLIPISNDLFPEFYLTTYWQSPVILQTVLDLDTGIFQEGTRRLEMRLLHNHLINGDFNRSPYYEFLSINTYPWQLAFQDVRAGTGVQLVSEQAVISRAFEVIPNIPGSQDSHIRLNNTLGLTFLTYSIPDSKQGATYLLVGEARVPKNADVLVMQTVQGENQNLTQIALDNQNYESWNAFAGVFSVVEAGPIYFILGVPGEISALAEFDNVGLFEIYPDAVIP